MIAEVIKATREHIPIIQRIARETWPETFRSILSVDQIDYMLELMYSHAALVNQMNETGHIFLLLKRENVFCGYVSYQTNYNGKPGTKIHKLYILPASQGMGIGKALVLAVELAAIAAQNYFLTLNVNRDNKAINFYNALDFEKVGEEDIDIGNGFLMQDAILRKELLAPGRL